MTTDQPVAESTHNHPPACCCQGEFTDCPVCPEHGTKPAPIECPQCHEPVGRPHTEYCTLAPGKVWDGVLPTGYAPDPVQWMEPGCTCDHRFGTELEHDDLCPARDWDA